MKHSILSCVMLLSTSLPAATPDNHAKSSFLQVAPVAASNGNEFYVAWSQPARDPTIDGNGTFAPLIGQRIASGGTPLDAAGLEIAPRHRPHTRDIAFGDSVYLAVWDDGGIFGAFILPSGQKLPTFPIHAAIANYEGVAVVWDGHRFFVVWSEEGRIHGAFVSSDGIVTEPRQLSSNPPAGDTRPQRFPDVAWNGNHFLIGWTSYIEGSVDTSANFAIDSSVRLIAADGIPVGDSLPLQIDVTRVHIASNNAEFYVVMQGVENVTATGVRIQGSDLITDPTVATIFKWYIADKVGTNVTFDGADYVIALRYRVFNTPNASWLATKHVRTTGAPYRQRVTAIRNIGNFEEPAIASTTAGNVLLATSFTDPAVEFPHVYTYLESELGEMPPPPPAPTNVVALQFAKGDAKLFWSGAPGDRGYVIEVRYPNAATFSYLRTESPDSRSAILAYSASDFLPAQVRVRALGPGGISDPSVAVSVQRAGRRRATAH